MSTKPKPPDLQGHTTDYDDQDYLKDNLLEGDEDVFSSPTFRTTDSLEPPHCDTHDLGSNLLVITIDYGTTNLGISFATLGPDEASLEDIKIIDNWGPKMRNYCKISSVYSNSPASPAGEQQWVASLSPDVVTFDNVRKSQRYLDYTWKDPEEIVTDYLAKVSKYIARLPFIEDHDYEQTKFCGYSQVWPVRIHTVHQMLQSIEPKFVAVKRLSSQNSKDFKAEADRLTASANRQREHLVELLATYIHEGNYHILFPYANENPRSYWKDAGSWDRDICPWLLHQTGSIASILNAMHNSQTSMELNTEVPLGATSANSGAHSHVGNLTVKEEGKFGHHWDIKPQNILWLGPMSDARSKGILQVADFGLDRFHRLSVNSARLAVAALEPELERNWISCSLLRWKPNVSVESHFFGEDELCSAGNARWIGWSLGYNLPMEYSYLQPIWDKVKIGWQSTFDLRLGSRFLKNIDLVRSTDAAAWFVGVSKLLLRVSRGVGRGPGQYSSNRLAFPYILLWAKLAAAELLVKGGVDSAAKPCPSSSTSNLLHEIEYFFHELIKPWWHNTEIAMSPEALLVACFLCSSLTVVLFIVRRHDNYQKYFLATGTFLSAILGMTCSDSARDFIFRYLFCGVNLALALSAFCHGRYSQRQNSSVEQCRMSEKESTDQEGKFESSTFEVEKIQNM